MRKNKENDINFRGFTEAVEKLNLTYNSKFTFSMTSTDFLGYTISEG